MPRQERIVGQDENKKYIIGDAVEVLQDYKNKASLIYLDDAWARPQRAGQFGVTYPTHAFSEDDKKKKQPRRTTRDILDACYDALEEGGWLIADADDWLLPKLIQYLQREWGNVAETYKGGGYRKIGGVTYLKKGIFESEDETPQPDRSTAGMYLSNGGYPVVFAHKGETTRKTSTSARQVSTRQNKNYGWGSAKPTDPYREWINALLKKDELLIVPCAGTAPAAVAAEQLYGEEAKYACIDVEQGAYEAFMRRRQDEIQSRPELQEFDD